MMKTSTSRKHHAIGDGAFNTPVSDWGFKACPNQCLELCLQRKLGVRVAFEQRCNGLIIVKPGGHHMQHQLEVSGDSSEAT